MMIRKAGRGAHRRPDARGRRAVTVLLALVAAAGTSALVFTSVAGNRADPQPVRVAPTAAPVTVPADEHACEVTVARAREVVVAAQPSFSHWSGHVRAEVDLDAGRATLEQTRARWAATKATADADLADFATAYSAFEAVQDGCADRAAQADRAVVPSPTMAECRTEFAALSTAVTAAKAVVDDWSAHVEMMKGKEHTDPAQYGRMWHDMVAAAPTNLARFSEASLELTNHVDCPRPE
jgi:hypothetical protein